MRVDRWTARTLGIYRLCKVRGRTKNKLKRLTSVSLCVSEHVLLAHFACSEVSRFGAFLITLPFLGMLIGGVLFVFVTLSALGRWSGRDLIMHAVIAVLAAALFNRRSNRLALTGAVTLGSILAINLLLMLQPIGHRFSVLLQGDPAVRAVHRDPGLRRGGHMDPVGTGRRRQGAPGLVAGTQHPEGQQHQVSERAGVRASVRGGARGDAPESRPS